MNTPRSNWLNEWTTAILDRDQPPTPHVHGGHRMQAAYGGHRMQAAHGAHRIQATPSTERRSVESPLIPGWMAMLPVLVTATWLAFLLMLLSVF